MGNLPQCVPPVELSQKIQELGAFWAASKNRPRLDSQVKRHWDVLIDAWADSELPLVIRKSSGVRGAEIVHATGRRLVLADNSPAQWAFTRAFARVMYSLAEIKSQIESGKIPFAFATKTSEKAQMKYTGTLSSADNVNKRGWKLCHVEPIGLGSRIPVNELPIGQLVEHFALLLKPSNHFLVPLCWEGLGELREVIQEIRKYELENQ